jgi:hypothetical protein
MPSFSRRSFLGGLLGALAGSLACDHASPVSEALAAVPGPVAPPPEPAVGALGDTITLSYCGLPDGLSIDAGTGLISDAIEWADAPCSATLSYSARAFPPGRAPYSAVG